MSEEIIKPRCPITNDGKSVCVWISRKLSARMKTLRNRVRANDETMSWSRVAANAFEAFLDEHEADYPPPDDAEE